MARNSQRRHPGKTCAIAIHPLTVCHSTVRRPYAVSVLAALVLLALVPRPGAAPQYEVLHAFAGGASDGATPQDTAVVFDAANNLYGTTMLGGSGFGTVYKIAADGTFGLLHSFSPVTDGALPDATLTLDAATGTLYGTTYQWGTFGQGSVFKIGTNGSGFEVLHMFAGGANDGAQPLGRLVLAGDGYLYGTTYAGGASNLGTVFRVKTDKTGFEVLHGFGGVAVSDGANPFGGLVLQGANLYGTTNLGGTAELGAVFALTTMGTGYAIVHHFDGDGGQGGYPVGELVVDGSGTVYGSTTGGGSFSCGTVYRIGTDGSHDVLHEFGAFQDDGCAPRGALALRGNSLYGATMFGGVFSRGTLFTLATDGSDFSFLYHFEGGPNVPDADLGCNPRGGVALDASGNLYGTTQNCGIDDNGVLFKFSGGVTDVTPPTYSCTPPSNASWFNMNVEVTCTASDSGSGLANPANASFTLSTDVFPDTETDSAATDSRTVCDFAGNCTDVGPYSGYKVDLRPPTVSIASPVDNATFNVGQPVAADYDCSDSGAGLASCTGSVPNGSPLDTATPGDKTFTVTAFDRVGRQTQVSVGYTVATIRTPAAIELISSTNPSTLGQTVTFTATVTGATPTGSVTFTVNGAPVKTVLVQAVNRTTATATFQTGTLGNGTRQVAAIYSGDGTNFGATSNTVSQVISGTRATGRAARAILNGLANNAIIVALDRMTGRFGADAWISASDVNHLAVGNSFAAGFSGPRVSASSLTGATLAGIGTGAARAVAYRTVLNTTNAVEEFTGNAIADGVINVPNLGHVTVAVYIIETDAFLSALDGSGLNLEQFLVGQDPISAIAAGTEAQLSLARRFSSGVRGSHFQKITASTPATDVAARAFLEPGKGAVIIFDLTVYAPPGAVVNFSDTLKPAPVFLTDASGNPSPLTLDDSVPADPPVPGALTLSPPSTTASLTTPITVTATATSGNGTPVPGTTVAFAIASGPNQQGVAPAVTDAEGKASFSYLGGSATGTDQIRATIGALSSNLAAVTWTAGPLDHITISPASATIAAGGSQPYTAQAFDQFGNSRGDVTAATTFTIAPDGSCTGATCTASTAGPHTVIANNNGKMATASLNVTASSGYGFQGFFEPIDMSVPGAAVWNTVKAGQAVPVKWLLMQDGVPVADPNSFAGLFSYPIACPGAGSIEDAIEQTAASNSGLQYNGEGYWQINWRTPASERGSCRAVTVKFSNGTTSPAAHFKLK